MKLIVDAFGSQTLYRRTDDAVFHLLHPFLVGKRNRRNRTHTTCVQSLVSFKEVGWTFSDQEEAAVYDMRLGMEKNYLFGVKARISDPEKNDTVLLTGGIWHQAGGEFTYKKGELNQNAVISMMRQAFTGNAGTKRKVLIGGSGLIDTKNVVPCPFSLLTSICP